MPKLNLKSWPFVIVLVLVCLRLPALINPVLDVDESIYGLFSRIWFDGGVPYVNCVETKPLGIYLFFGGVFSIFGRFNMYAVHAVTILIVAVTSFYILRIASTLYSKRAGIFAALFYVVFSTTYIPKYIATTIEPIMLLPIVLQFYFWIRYERTTLKRYALYSGLCFSIACLFKYQAGINLFVMLLYLFVAKPIIDKKASLKSDVSGFIVFLIAACPLPLLMIAYLWQLGALQAFWYWNVTGNLDYISEGASSISLAKRLLTRVLPYMVSTALVWVLACVGIKEIANNMIKRIADKQTLFIIIWFALTIIPVSAGYRFYGHYFLLLLPPLCILASNIMDRVWDVRIKKAIIITAMVIPAVGFFSARFFINDINKSTGEDNLIEYKPLAEYVLAKTSAKDRILVWGFAPLVYWYSERMPATRFFWSDVLTGRVPGLQIQPKDADRFMNPSAWEMFWQDMAKGRPKYIIDTAPSGLHDYKDFPVDRYPKLWEYIKENYKLEVVQNGAKFYKLIE